VPTAFSLLEHQPLLGIPHFGRDKSTNFFLDLLERIGVRGMKPSRVWVKMDGFIVECASYESDRL
jgi:hypothetical protein